MASSLLSWFELGLGILGIILLLVITVLLLLIVLLPIILRSKKMLGDDVKISVRKLNDIYEKNKNSLNSVILSEKEQKKLAEDKKARDKEKLKSEKKGDLKTSPRIFVLDFKGDIGASQVTYLREQVTALLQVATKEDEIVVRLESPGGLVHTYGLAASQLARIRENHIPLTVCVDKVAASGGYMMACLANKIYAAPFAILGSIGVVSNVPNFSKFLKKHDVDYFEITAGQYKRTLTPFGEPTTEKIEKSKEKVHEIHVLFKDHVKHYRDNVDIENISTGDYWFGHQAIDLKLIDGIRTSDDYLLERSREFEVYVISSPQAQSLRQKLFSGFSNLWYTLFNH